MNSFQLKWCLFLLSILAIGVVHVIDAADHEVGVQVELSTDHLGPYPYPPDGTVGHGGFQIPSTGTVNSRHYDCRSIAHGWLAANKWGKEKMLGVVLYRTTDGTDVQGLFTHSGTRKSPLALAPPLSGQNYIGNDVITSWSYADESTYGEGPTTVWSQTHSGVRATLESAFKNPRSCFGRTSDPGSQCEVTSDGAIVRSIVNRGSSSLSSSSSSSSSSSAPKLEEKVENRSPRAPPVKFIPYEAGFPSGVCALSKLVIELDIRGILKDQLICAAEITVSGWINDDNDENIIAKYERDDIVPSCVTCQQVVPLLLSSCPVSWIEQSLGSGDALGECDRDGQVLLEGESCTLACRDGFSLSPTTRPAKLTCMNGRLSPLPIPSTQRCQANEIPHACPYCTSGPPSTPFTVGPSYRPTTLPPQSTPTSTPIGPGGKSTSSSSPYSTPVSVIRGPLVLGRPPPLSPSSTSTKLKKDTGTAQPSQGLIVISPTTPSSSSSSLSSSIPIPSLSSSPPTTTPTVISGPSTTPTTVRGDAKRTSPTVGRGVARHGGGEIIIRPQVPRGRGGPRQLFRQLSTLVQRQPNEPVPVPDAHQMEKIEQGILQPL